MLSGALGIYVAFNVDPKGETEGECFDLWVDPRLCAASRGALRSVMKNEGSYFHQFSDRHIGPDDASRTLMLEALGYSGLEELISDVVPQSIREKSQLALGEALSEVDALAEIRSLMSENNTIRSLIGMGYYGTHTPGVIKRNILENPAWYTAYTPYQPEISQGRLEALINFQTMVAELTGMHLSNASMLDEGTAAAEAMTLAFRVYKGSSNTFLVDADTHPQTIAVVQTRAKPLHIHVETWRSGEPIPDAFGLLLSYPGSSGRVRDISEDIAQIHGASGLAIVASDLLALTLLKSPGSLGADVVVGSAQRFGVPMGFGGPHAGFMGVRAGLERSMPGRLVGVSVDDVGTPAMRLSLQTREQHIRREKATSNICTAQVLLAVMASMYAVYHGPRGLQGIAKWIADKATSLSQALTRGNYEVQHESLFDTVTFKRAGQSSGELLAQMLSIGFNIRRVDDEWVSISIDETVTDGDIDAIATCLGIVIESTSANFASLSRTDEFLTHPVFHAHHNETSMLRYIRTLSDRDLALDRTMIPLGSCTMKLNATSEMEPVTWPEISNLHPFAPADQSRGIRTLITQLSAWLVEITGYDAISLQPNAGSQGEFAGLLAIRQYLDAKGDTHRNICLIPSSAHGTNAASAVMAGMEVVVVGCDTEGNVDLIELKSKIMEHHDNLAALMITYPSTHGVFEEAITDICAMVHDAGGQVYVDGANLNALVGLAKPGKFGADVSHLNLHKTFCIPHGGGGPGVGPVGVRAHLAPYLPNHPLDLEAGPVTGPGPISAAPFGSASILPIPWMYIRMMGAQGLTEATSIAILSANYIAAELSPDYPILYSGKSGRIAHECILDIRPLTKESGVTVDDIAKRLMDFGFHAPTMSFPVAGTLMIEPTESEDLFEIERFIRAMRIIKSEANAIAAGEIALEESPLRHAPHTTAVMVGEWDRKYSRQVAAFPDQLSDRGGEMVFGARGKYWPSVGRIDGAYGDRNLVCACPPIESYAGGIDA